MPPENHILSLLGEADMAALQPYLENVELPVRLVLETPNVPISHVFFMTSGIASVVAGTGSEDIEAGILGADGMTGTAIVLAASQTPNKTIIQIGGTGWRIEAGRFREEMQKSASMHRCFMRSAFAFNIQTTHSVLANGRAKVDERLARWLLMAHDRIDGNELAVTHEFLSLMLGVRRAGVTTVVGSFEDLGYVTAERGLITVLNRAGLKSLAGGFYGVPEKVQLHLTGWHCKH